MFIDLVTNRLTAVQVGSLQDCFTACLPACLSAWLPACLTDCLPACLTDWLTDSLLYWSRCMLCDSNWCLEWTASDFEENNNKRQTIIGRNDRQDCCRFTSKHLAAVASANNSTSWCPSEPQTRAAFRNYGDSFPGSKTAARVTWLWCSTTNTTIYRW